MGRRTGAVSRSRTVWVSFFGVWVLALGLFFEGEFGGFGLLFAVGGFEHDFDGGS
jgi:hypothetical protein